MMLSDLARVCAARQQPVVVAVVVVVYVVAFVVVVVVVVVVVSWRPPCSSFERTDWRTVSLVK